MEGTRALRTALWSVALAGLACSGAAGAQSAPQPRTVTGIYRVNCSACHGLHLLGLQGPALITASYAHGTSDAEVTRTIHDGYPQKGMPAFGSILSAEQIASLVAYLKKERFENTPQYLAAQDAKLVREVPRGVQESELESFRIEVVAELGKTFGMAFLPDGRLLVTTEGDGGLRIIDHDRLLAQPVTGTPHGHPINPVFFRRVLLDVAVHPDYRRNGWIYLTTSDSSKGPDGKGVELGHLVRGRLRDNTWVDSQVLATQQVDPATGRIAFDDKGHVFVSSSSDPGVTEARDGRPWSLEDLRRMPPQDLKSPQSKIMRYNDDGTIPADNPFVATPGAVPAIWSYGHRNPQGLAFDHGTGLLWETEHGPRGGDELNVIHGGHNYGFPAISYGTSYNGITFTTEIEQEGMDQPVINWTPSIAVSAIAFYEGSAFPKWQHDLFIGSLEHEELLRVRLRGERAMVRESVLKDLGRIRAVAVSPQGSLYLAMELKTEGLILRLVPAK